MTYYLEEILDSLKKIDGLDAQVRYLEAVVKNNDDKSAETVINELLKVYKHMQLIIKGEEKQDLCDSLAIMNKESNLRLAVRNKFDELLEQTKYPSPEIKEARYLIAREFSKYFREGIRLSLKLGEIYKDFPELF